MIQFDKVNKWYGDYHALVDIDETIAKGEVVVVCGPSGSGKSTLIRTINRLEAIDSGTIAFEGEDIHRRGVDLNRLRSRIGFVFQQFNLFPHLTVLENCMLAPMKARGTPKAEAEANAMKYLTRVRIPEHAKKHPAQLSGGQQQRVAIARALCMTPKIMLFDEPTSALDPEMVKEVLETMIGLADEGMTMLCVTHEMGFARSVADRVLFMDRGEIVEQAPPDEFFTAPKHERLRDFLGQILHK